MNCTQLRQVLEVLEEIEHPIFRETDKLFKLKIARARLLLEYEINKQETNAKMYYEKRRIFNKGKEK